jgi:hypothetical protein
MDAAAAQNVLFDLDVRLSQTEDDIQRLLSRDTVRIQASWGLQQYRMHVEDVLDRSMQLSEILTTASAMTERVNVRMRMLDTAQRNASLAFQRVADVADLKLCLDGLQSALASSDLSAAGVHAERFLRMGPAVQDDATAAKLHVLVAEGAALAEKELQKDPGNWSRVAALCAFGRAPVAAKLYSAYLVGRIATDSILDVLDSAAAVVEAEEPRMSEVFGDTSLVQGVLRDIMSAAEATLSPLLHSLAAELDASVASDDPRQMDSMLEKTAEVASQCELFDTFMHQRCAGSGAASKASSVSGASKDAGTASIKQALVGVMGAFARLIDRFISLSTSQAVTESEPEYLVDDVFFIFQTAQRRARDAASSNMLSCAVHSICETVSSAVMPVLVRGANWNGLEQCARYIRLLAEDLQGEAAAEPYGDVAKQCTDTLHAQLRAIANQFCETRVALLFIPLERVNYAIDDAAYAQYEVDDPFVFAFTAKITKAVDEAGMRTSLSEANCDFVLLCVVDFVVSKFERTLLAKRSVSQLGGLQVDKDIRNLSAYFSGQCKTTVRDRFARLGFIAALLTMDRLSEVRDLYGGKQSVLDIRDVKRVLKLRPDFGEQAIDKLRL